VTPTVWSTDGMTLTRQPQYSEKNMSQCHFVHCKYHMDWPGTKLRPLS